MHGDVEGAAGFTLGLIGRFELILVEWHLTPEYLLDNWTDEQLERFWSARNNRVLEMDRTVKRMQEQEEQGFQPSRSRRVSDDELARIMSQGANMARTGRA